MEVEELKKYVGKVVKLKYAYEFRNFDEYRTVLGSIKQIDEKFGYIYIGHPYDIENQETTCGEMGIRYKFDDYEISSATEDEFKLWLANYKDFSRSVIKVKGYDSCQEDIKNITY